MNLLFLFVLGLFFTSCSQDANDDEPSNQISLVGFWTRYADNDQYMEEFSFFNDGTCKYLESYEPDDDNDAEPEYDFGEGTYSIEGDKLTLRLYFNDELEVWTYTIKSLKSKSELELQDEYGDSYIYSYFEGF